MTPEQQQVNDMIRKIGSSLITIGSQILRNAFSGLKPMTFNIDKIKSSLDKAGLPITLYSYDGQFSFIDWDTWEIITDLVLLDKTLYLAERRDCDNYTYLFSSLASWLFGLNTCGAAMGTIYNSNTGERIGGHLFNLIITFDGKVYLFDTLNFGFCLVEKGKQIIINHWRYTITSVDFH
jgi:hypothetical protein